MDVRWSQRLPCFRWDTRLVRVGLLIGRVELHLSQELPETKSNGADVRRGRYGQHSHCQ